MPMVKVEPGISISLRPRSNVLRSNRCHAMAELPAGMREPRGMAMSRAVGMVSVRS